MRAVAVHIITAISKVYFHLYLEGKDSYVRSSFFSGEHPIARSDGVE